MGEPKKVLSSQISSPSASRGLTHHLLLPWKNANTVGRGWLQPMSVKGVIVTHVLKS